ncbi:hypothetical protein HZH66_012415 [Vespula vulgaris]|uniref:Uncharacterized protein n=1 Tax=Vespula vulgaris TaxID=7454 RepID=A0A834MT13_VESVU|nr:hypothetical protein HZH66_012415 [Vespula vulgaris]
MVPVRCTPCHGMCWNRVAMSRAAPWKTRLSYLLTPCHLIVPKVRKPGGCAVLEVGQTKDAVFYGTLCSPYDFWPARIPCDYPTNALTPFWIRACQTAGEFHRPRNYRESLLPRQQQYTTERSLCSSRRSTVILLRTFSQVIHGFIREKLETVLFATFVIGSPHTTIS